MVAKIPKRLKKGSKIVLRCGLTSKFTEGEGLSLVVEGLEMRLIKLSISGYLRLVYLI